jgi:hypothetical protein
MTLNHLVGCQKKLGHYIIYAENKSSNIDYLIYLF